VETDNTFFLSELTSNKACSSIFGATITYGMWYMTVTLSEMKGIIILWYMKVTLSEVKSKFSTGTCTIGVHHYLFVNKEEVLRRSMYGISLS
jgi:hypothetical protein